MEIANRKCPVENVPKSGHCKLTCSEPAYNVRVCQQVWTDTLRVMAIDEIEGMQSTGIANGSIAIATTAEKPSSNSSNELASRHHHKDEEPLVPSTVSMTSSVSAVNSQNKGGKTHGDPADEIEIDAEEEEMDVVWTLTMVMIPRPRIRLPQSLPLRIV